MKFPATCVGIYLLGVLADTVPGVPGETAIFDKFGVIGGIAVVSTLAYLYIIKYLLDERKELAKQEREDNKVLTEALTKLTDVVNELKDKIK